MLKKILVCLFASIPAVCAAFPNLASAERLPAGSLESSENGVIIVATGAKEGCANLANRLRIQELSTRETMRDLPMDGRSMDSAFSTHQGFVSAVALKPGKYRAWPIFMHPHVKQMVITTYDFEVRANETTYIGEVFISPSCSLSNQYVTNDQYERDVGVAIQKNPAIAARYPVKRLMQTGETFESGRFDELYKATKILGVF